jgi:hypothetical protein
MFSFFLERELTETQQFLSKRPTTPVSTRKRLLVQSLYKARCRLLTYLEDLKEKCLSSAVNPPKMDRSKIENWKLGVERVCQRAVQIEFYALERAGVSPAEAADAAADAVLDAMKIAGVSFSHNMYLFFEKWMAEPTGVPSLVDQQIVLGIESARDECFLSQYRNSDGCRTAGPAGPSQSPVIIDLGTKEGRRAAVDAYIDEVLRRTGERITRTMIWQAAGYPTKSQFMKWQRMDQDESKAAATRFEWVLREKPHIPLNS